MFLIFHATFKIVLYFTASCMKNIVCIQTSLEDDGENLREEFNRFLGTMLSVMSEKHEQDELGILNS